MDRFSKQKKHAINKLDVSIRVGDADEGILGLLKTVNSSVDYYTTSSCAGRIQLFQDLGSKIESQPIACWHRKVEYSEVAEEFKKVKGVLYFKCEPPILHIAARNIEAARKLLIVARESGFKHSGVQSIKPERVMVELISTENIDAPIANEGKKLVTDEYLGYLVGLANKKHSKAQTKIRKLKKNIKALNKCS